MKIITKMTAYCILIGTVGGFIYGVFLMGSLLYEQDPVALKAILYFLGAVVLLVLVWKIVGWALDQI